MESAMGRATNWAGAFSVAVAVGTAFFAGQAVGRREVPTIQLGDTSEASDAPPVAFDDQPLLPPQLIEDPACPSTPRITVTAQSAEPPLALSETSHFRLTEFSMPVSDPPMPYIIDDPMPAYLPHLTDVSDLPQSQPDADNPLFRAVRNFVEGASRNDPPATSPDKR
jgi:hypothetical protein